MRRRPVGVGAAGVLLCLFLGACATPSPAPEPAERERAYAARSEALGRWPGWSLSGRLGIRQDGDGGSGRIEWAQQGAEASMGFRGALGQGAWRITTSPDGARLERADGEVRVAPGLAALVYAETGWDVPVRALAWWVRGLASPGAGPPRRLELNGDGTPRLLEQQGWSVAYERYGSGPGGQALPTRLEARRGDVTIKLAVSRWTRLQAQEQADG
jgi:outer membrane lipoprotein LolB